MGPFAAQLLKILGVSAGTATFQKLISNMQSHGVDAEQMVNVLTNPALKNTPLGEKVGSVISAVFGENAGEFVSDLLTSKQTENERDDFRRAISPYVPDSAREPSEYAQYYWGGSDALPTREMVAAASENVAKALDQETKIGLYEQIFVNFCNSNADQYLLLIAFINSVAARGGYADAVAYEQVLERRRRMSGFINTTPSREVRAELASMRALFRVTRK